MSPELFITLRYFRSKKRNIFISLLTIISILGVVIAVHPYPALISIGIFIVFLLITRYVSLSSMIAGFSFPLQVMLVFKTTTISLVVFSLIIAVILLVTHQKNIERLLKKEESKANLFKKKKEEVPPLVEEN